MQRSTVPAALLVTIQWRQKNQNMLEKDVSKIGEQENFALPIFVMGWGFFVCFLGFFVFLNENTNPDHWPEYWEFNPCEVTKKSAT